MPLANKAPERLVNLGSFFYGFTSDNKKDSLFSAINLFDAIENSAGFGFDNYKFTDGSAGIDETTLGRFALVETGGEINQIRINQENLLNSDISEEIIGFVNASSITTILFKNNSNQNIGFFVIENAVLENNYVSLDVVKAMYFSNFNNEEEYKFELNFIKKAESKVLRFQVNTNNLTEIKNEFNNASRFALENPEDTLVKAIYVTPQGVTPFKTTTKIYQLITKPQFENDELVAGDFGFGGQIIKNTNLELVYVNDSDSEDIQEIANTVIYLNNIGSSSVKDYINSSNTIRTISDFQVSTTLIKSIIDGNQTDYIYKGSGGVYGQNQTDQLTDNDLQLVNQENQGATLIFTNTNLVPETTGGYIAGQPATPAEGLNIQESMDKLLFKPIAPTLTLTATPQPEFNQPVNYNISLNWTVQINSVGASIDSLLLEFRRGSDSWTTLTTDINLTTINHNITSVDNRNIDYRLTVTDTKGASKTINITRSVQNYSQPSGSITKAPFQNVIERGVDITVNSSVTRNRQYAIISNVKLQKSINGGVWATVREENGVDLGALINLTEYISSNGNNDAQVKFRILVTDSGNSNNAQIALTTTDLILPYFFGKSSSAITPTQGIFTGANKVVANSSGTININFNANGEYLWFATPVGSTTKTNWFVTALNAGNIGDSTDLWAAPIIITINSPDGLWTQDYKVYVTNNATTIDVGMELRN